MLIFFLSLIFSQDEPNIISTQNIDQNFDDINSIINWLISNSIERPVAQSLVSKSIYSNSFKTMFKNFGIHITGGSGTRYAENFKINFKN